MISIKKLAVLSMAAALSMGFTACNSKTGSLKNDSLSSNDSLAMARGYVTGSQIQQQLMMSEMQGQKMDKEAMLRGIKDGMSHAADSAMIAYYYGQLMGYQYAQGNIDDRVSNEIFYEYLISSVNSDSTKIKWTQEEAMALLQAKTTEMRQQKMQEKYGDNKKAGEEYAAKFKKEEGVVVLPSGVAYKVITPGKGTVKPTDTDHVKVNYQGRLIDGTVFDETKDTPIEFGVTQVIQGWTEMLKEMTEGEKVTVVIPENLAYGERGSGDKIKPLSTLVFDIELVKIVAPEKK